MRITTAMVASDEPVAPTPATNRSRPPVYGDEADTSTDVEDAASFLTVSTSTNL